MSPSQHTANCKAGAYSRLILHDWLIARTLVRSSFTSLADLLTLSIGGPILILVGHARLAELSDVESKYLFVVLGFTAALALARAVSVRLDVHQTDGVLAMDALRCSTVRRYVAAIISVTFLAMAILGALLDSRGLVPGLVSGSLGLVIGRLWRALEVSGPAKSRYRRRSFVWQDWLRRPSSGVTLAIVLCVTVFIAKGSLSQSALIGLIGVPCAILSVLLTPVDPAIVRFMSQSGFNTWHTVGLHARGLALFATLTGLFSFLVVGFAGLSLVLASAALFGWFLCLRVLVYRIHAKRRADWTATIIVSVIAVVTFSVPFALPIALGASLWWLWRRARSMTWMVA